MEYVTITAPNFFALKTQQEFESANETNPEAPKIDLKDVSKTYEAMIQYMCGIRGCDGVPLRYVAQPKSDPMPIVESSDTSNTYATYDEEMVKIVLMIEAGHAANAREEYGCFSDTFIRYRRKFWDIISPLLHVTNAWPHVKSARNNRNGQKATLAFYDHFLGQTTWFTYRIRQR